MNINDKVSILLEKQIEAGRQIGVQVCVYKDDEKVVDTCAGTMGRSDNRPVAANTLFLSFSATKGVASTALHILADKGLIEYDVPVTEYWEAFGKHGKEKITVAEAMSHQAGIHAMPSPCILEHLIDWDTGIRWVEESVPAYEPGTAQGYHGTTFAWIVGGIIQGATGRHVKDVIREEIAAPLGVGDDLFVGLPDNVEDRIAEIEILSTHEGWKNLTGKSVPADSDLLKAIPAELWGFIDTPEFRKACIPSANGHFSARALAKMYAALICEDSIDGVRLVSPERVKSMQRVMTDRFDRVYGQPRRFSIGYALGGANAGILGVLGPRKTCFGHQGAGGSVGFADPEAGLAMAVTLNKMAYDLPQNDRTKEICDLVREEYGVN